MTEHTVKTAAPESDPLMPKNYAIKPVSLLVSTLAISILSLALPVMTLQVYDRILPSQGSGTLPVLIVGVCVAVVLEALLRLCRAYVIGRSGATYEHLLSCAAMGKILNSDFSRVGSQGIGEHLHRMNSVSKIKDFYNGYALTTYAELVFVPIYLILIAFISGYLVLVPCSILLLFIAVSMHKGRNLKAALLDREKSDDQRFNFLIEALEGIHTLKAFAVEKFFERRYEALEEDSTRRNYAVTEQTSEIFNTASTFSHIMVAAVISIGALFVLDGHITTGVLIATLLLSGRMMQPVQKALGLWTRYQDYMLARAHVAEVLSMPQHILQVQEKTEQVLPTGNIEVRGLRFRYRDDDPWVLDGINFTMKPGEAVLLQGANGSGRSTFFNILAGIHFACEGEVLIDGCPIEGYKPETLSRHIGYIRTSSVIFRGTIRDNITCFGQIEEEKAREVASIMRVDRDVARLPGGFDTFLNGNNTDSIPHGLGHKIALVRVLATKPKIILFDNADRTLDKEGYSMIYSLFARLKGKVSMLLVSEDRNICGLSDRSIVLDQGRIRETDEVFSKGNVRPYKELRI
jgi:ATP-binding cassette subfamily C protein LapB